MKKQIQTQRLSDAIGEAAEPYLAEADETAEDLSRRASADAYHKSKNKKKNLRYAAGGLAAALLIGVGVKILPSIPLRACAVETAEYPGSAAYPTLGQTILQGIFSGFDFDAARINYNNSNGRRDEARAAETRERIYALTERALPYLLTGEAGENRVCSPLNFYFAASVLCEITGGVSREELLSLLGEEDISSLEIHANMAWLFSYTDDGVNFLLPANSLWLDDSIDVKESTAKRLAENFYASTYRGNMGGGTLDQALRKWLDGQTGGALSQKTEKLSFSPDDVLAIASTLALRAKWDDKFSKSQTKPGTFHASEGDLACDFMHKEKEENAYYWADRFSAVREKFEHGGGMWFILPDEGVDIDTLLSDPALYSMLCNPSYGMEYEWSDTPVPEDALFHGKEIYVNLTVPKFDVTDTCDLLPAFEKLGAPSLLIRGLADFSELTDTADIALSSASHAARVKIDEEGCEAASYVVIRGAGAAAPPEGIVDFVLDRPFLFVAVSEENYPLYAGYIENP